MKRMMIALGLALSGAPTAAQQAPAAPDYAEESAWLCLPGRDDACGRPLPTTALNANGFGSVGQVRPAPDASIDCFYVYPTVSRDPAMNSDLETGPEEQVTAMVQFAHFASVCRPFAPIYRQASLASIPAVIGGADVTPIFAIAYRDVLAAWRHYLQHHNQGRPFVLIGHSQGTIHLTRLLAEEIEGAPAHGRLLSAILLGFNVEVPEGQTVGGSFRETPLCTRPGQIGCVITYVSFRATNPPPAQSLFGRALRPGMTVGCTNPAALGRRGSAPLDSYWFTAASAAASALGGPIVWSAEGEPPTPFLRTEGLVDAACVNRGAVGYLSVLVNSDPADPRTDRIPGDVAVAGQIQPAWGLHLSDMNLAQGDLIRAIEVQGQVFARR